jgi:hypothetical protein
MIEWWKYKRMWEYMMKRSRETHRASSGCTTGILYQGVVVWVHIDMG